MAILTKKITKKVQIINLGIDERIRKTYKPVRPRLPFPPHTLPQAVGVLFLPDFFIHHEVREGTKFMGVMGWKRFASVRLGDKDFRDPSASLGMTGKGRSRVTAAAFKLLRRGVSRRSRFIGLIIEVKAVFLNPADKRAQIIDA